MSISVTTSADQALLTDIVLLYQGVFDRQPDLGGIDYWYNVGHAAGDDIHAVANAFLPQSFLGLGVAGFLNLMYVDTLGRNPDVGGYAYWTDQIVNHHQSYGDVALNFALSAEFQHDVGTSAAQLAFEIANGTGSPDPTMPLPGSPVWMPTPPTIVDVPGPTVFVPTPTAEAHDVTFAQAATVSAAGLQANGTMLFGSGNLGSPYVQAVDHTANIELDMQPIYRTSGEVQTPVSVVTTGTSITATFDMEKGTQLGDHGEQNASLTHSGISIDFAAIGLNIGNSADYKVILNLQGSGVATQSFHLSTTAAGVQTWVNDTTAGANITDNNMPSTPTSVVAAENSENLAFFSNTPNLPSGTYTESIQLVGTSGLNNGHLLASVTDVIVAS